MKIFYLFLLAVSFSLSVNAQMPGGGKNIPNMGHIYGKVVDSSGRGIGAATVVLLTNRFDTVSKKNKSVMLKGLSTSSGGNFSLEDLPMFGPLTVKISATGYKPYQTTVVFKMAMPAGGAKPTGDPAQAMAAMSNALNGFDKDLGNIKLSTDVTQLAGVTVTAAKPTLTMDIDKKTYNVEKDIVNAGGTALDVMKNVPSVAVDIDGNVTVRNATPQIYIDGRPTTLTLDQIPADAIESVEVITNPSAKYDASSSAGILNIVLKKNRKSGYNGNVRAGVDSRGGVNGGLNMNVRQNKFNFTAAGFINQNRGVTRGNTERLTTTDTPTTVHQSNYDKNRGGFAFGSLGFDYFMTPRTTFTLTGIKVHGEFKPIQTLDISSTEAVGGTDVTLNSQRNAMNKREFNANGLQFAFKHLFPKEGESISADVNYFAGHSNGNALYVTDYFTGGQGSAVDHFSQQQVIGNGKNKFFTAQTDYVHPFDAKTKLEAGLRMNYQHLINNNYNYYDNAGTGDFVLFPLASTNYENSNYIYAGYASFTSAIKDFGYQVGLRAESSRYNGELTNTKEVFANKYPISLFPSVFLSQKLANKQELQASYTRRINRPNFFQLIPFTDYTDSLNITRGNANLRPEFITSVEMSYSKTLPGNNTFLGSIYYKKTDNLITRYIDTFTNALSGKQDLVNTYINASYSQSFGAELTAVTNLTQWWDLTTNVNLYNSKIHASSTAVSQDALWSWYGKLNSNFKLPWKLKLQITGTYQSRTNLPISPAQQQMGPPNPNGAQSSSQGYIRAFWFLDAAISRSFFKNDAGNVSVSIGDIFHSHYSDQHSFSQFFVQDYNRIRDPQLVRVNFTYRFGKLDVSLFKRKNLNGSGSQDAMQMQ